MRTLGSRVGSRVRRAFALAAACLASSTTPSCATIVAGGPDMVPVTSTPEGARVSLDGVAVGRTPCTVAFARSCEGVLKLDAPGYQDSVLDRDKVLNGWFLGNVILGGLIGITIDLCTSNQGKYSTGPVFVELIPATGTVPAPLVTSP